MSGSDVARPKVRTGGDGIGGGLDRRARSGWTGAALVVPLLLGALSTAWGQEKMSPEERDVIVGILLSPEGKAVFNERYDSQEALREATDKAVQDELVRRKLERHARSVLDVKETVCEMKRAGLLTGKSGVPTTIPILDEIRWLQERAADVGIPLEDVIAAFGGLLAGGPWGAAAAVAISEIIQKIAGHDPSVANSLTYLLFHSDRPTATGLTNPWVDHTKAANLEYAGPWDPDGGGPPNLPASREMLLAIRIAQSEGEGKVMPRDVMRMAIEVCGGDYPSATLTVHNLMKEITYGSRAGGEGVDACVATVNAPAGEAAQATWEGYQRAFQSMPGGFRVQRPEAGGEMRVHLDPNAILSKLADLRPDPDSIPLSEVEERIYNRLPKPAAIDDKGGPWYHAFGAMFVSSTAYGGRYTAELLTRGESALRHTPIFSSPPDPFKELLSNRAAVEGGKILDCLKDLGKYEKTDAGAPPGGQVSATGETSNWYCTNRPKNRQGMPAPDAARRGGDLPTPSAEEFAKAETELLAALRTKGVDPQPLIGFTQPFFRASPNVDKAKALWLRLLATGDARRIRDGLIERGQTLNAESVHSAIAKLRQEMPDERPAPAGGGK